MTQEKEASKAEKSNKKKENIGAKSEVSPTPSQEKSLDQKNKPKNEEAKT